MTETNPPTLRILGIFAHPDDAEFTVAGSAALWAGQGAHITYLVVTNGGAGSNAPAQGLDELVRIRHAEQTAACAVLGVQEVLFLDYPDGILEPTLDLRRALTRVIRRLKPDRVVCDDPSVLFLRQQLYQSPRSPRRGRGRTLCGFPLGADPADLPRTAE
jgi:LmbE family N-acetylglucosaminyl deacetylase